MQTENPALQSVPQSWVCSEGEEGQVRTPSNLKLPPSYLLGMPSAFVLGEIICKQTRQNLTSHAVCKMLLSFCWYFPSPKN